MGTQLPPEKRAHPLHPFLAHVYCGQAAGWMKTPLGTEVDLGPGHVVLNGVPAPAKGAHQPPLFRPCLLWPRSPISATAELLLAVLVVRCSHCRPYKAVTFLIVDTRVCCVRSEFKTRHRACLWKVYLSARLSSCVRPLTNYYVNIANIEPRTAAAQLYCQYVTF